eukprot:scaffold12693_cov142-Isochrysis_galbana.AAC.1
MEHCQLHKRGYPHGSRCLRTSRSGRKTSSMSCRRRREGRWIENSSLLRSSLVGGTSVTEGCGAMPRPACSVVQFIHRRDKTTTGRS